MNKNSSNLISIKGSNSEPIKKTIAHRDERIPIPNNIETVLILHLDNDKHSKFTIKDISTFGARIYSNESELMLRINQEVRVELIIQTITILNCTAVITNESNQSDGISYGISFTDQFLDLDKIRAVINDDGIREKFGKSSDLLNLLDKVEPEFKMLVADLNSFFQDLKNKLEVEQKIIAKNAISESHKKRMEEHTLALAVSLNIQSITDLFLKFQEIVDTLSPEENILHKRYFRLNFNNLITQTPFLKRAFEKPLGYAGDYGLMVMFYDYADMGINIFDKFMHRLSCNQPIAIANQNRVSYLSEVISSHYESRSDKEKYKISSIACGPAQEVKLFLQNTSLSKKDNIEVILLDQEGLALDHAIKSLREVGNPKCHFKLKAMKEDAVLGIIKRSPFVEEVDQSDIIICAGLFDYLSERVASKMIEKMYELLKPGGTLYIGNVSNENPNRFSMDYFMEWNLVVRSSSQMLELVPATIKVNKDNECSVVSESLGLNLFLRIKKSNNHE